MNWTLAPLREVAKVISGFAFKSADFQQDDGVPVIKISNIRNGDINLTDVDRVPIEFLGLDSKYHVSSGDILISLTGSHITLPNSVVGRVAKYRYESTALLNQRAGKIIPMPDTIDKEFLYQYLTLDNVRREIALMGHGGANQCNISPSNVEGIHIPIPPLPTQQKIASILSAYDDLIENNLKRIKLLEEAAQNIYREWFVNFRVNGELLTVNEETRLPKGWTYVPAHELFNISIGKTPPRQEVQWFNQRGEPSTKWVSIADINRSSVFVISTQESVTEQAISKFNMNVAKRGTVILSFKLTIGKVAITRDDMSTNEAIAHFNFREQCRLNVPFLYNYLSTFPYDSLGSTSSIGRALNSKVVKFIPILVPDLALLNKYQDIASPMFEQIENLSIQNQRLQQARDLLLPRLMDGSLEV